MTTELTIFGYSIAAVLYLGMSIALVTVWRGRFKGPSLFLASFITSIWCAVIAYGAAYGGIPRVMGFAVEVAADVAWLVFILSLFRGAIIKDVSLVGRYLGVVVGFAILAIGLASELWPATALPDTTAILIVGSIGTSLYSLIALEQIFRNVRVSARRNIRYLCLGIAGLFFVDLILYSNAVFAGRIGPLFWSVRGILLAMAAPLIAIAVHRRDRETPGIFVSREVVFYTTTIVATGVYLTAVGVIGQLVRRFDQQWGEAAQVVLFFGSALVFLLLILSEDYRRRLRVFVVKHFFENKYDYREEWLRLITTLTETDSKLPLQKRAVKSLAQILGSSAGTLWLIRDDGREVYAESSWNVTRPEKTIPGDHGLIRFMQEKQWVINLDEIRENSPVYTNLQADDIPEQFVDDWILSPLIDEEMICGFIALNRPAQEVQLNFEDHDLLKTAGKQIASYLGQDTAVSRLAEVKQFEAFSKLTAFLMHDLKNTMAQQLLIVKNAEKHKRNPDFVDDAIDSVKGSAERIGRVIKQLQQGTRTEGKDKVDVGKTLLIAISRSEDRQPIPEFRQYDGRVFVVINEERLLMALVHTIRNAQDATPDDGSVTIELKVSGDDCLIEISDTGAGMDATFIRERLFKPFDSTKGSQGMGIGAHQLRETLRGIGGDVTVQSNPGSGTTMLLRMPLAQ